MTMEVKFAQMKGVDPSGAFNQSFFGAVRPGETYQDLPNGIDRRNELKDMLNRELMRIAQLKYSGAQSAFAGGAGTAGVAMVPVYVSPLLTDRSRKLTPWVEMTARVANQGLTHDFNFIDSKDAAVFAGEVPALNDQDYTPDRGSVSMKYMYAKGRVSGPRNAAQPAYMISGYAGITGPGLGASPFGTIAAPNAMQTEVLIRTRALKELEENKFWNGSVSSDANEFNGVITTQSTTNKTDLNTTDLEYDDVESAVKDAYDDSGYPNYAGCSSSVLKDLRKIAIDTYRYSPADMTTQLPFGVTSRLTLETIVGSIPVIPSQYISNTTGSKAMYFLDMTEIYFAVLQDATFQALAMTTDAEQFVIKQYEALVMRAPAFNAFIGEIK